MWVRSGARTRQFGYVRTADPPERLSVGASGRAAYCRSRPRKLSPEQEAAIVAQAGTRSLRDLAADYDISPELVRLIVKRARLTTVTPLLASD